MTRLLLAASLASLLGAAPALAQNNDQNNQGVGKLNSQDRTFVQKAAQGGVAEVQAGQLAEKQASRPAVREFGRWMATDHAMINAWLQRIAMQDGVQVPATPSPQQLQQMTQLKGQQGAQFDQTYIQAQVQDHQKTLALFQQEAQSGQNPQLKFLAEKAIPALEQHLAEARDLQNLPASGGTASSGAQ